MSTERPTAAPARTVHMIGNAHIDPVWLWQWPEGFQEARATFWSAIQRMEEYPEFVFTCDQVALLEWVETADPELFDRIVERAEEGRWVNAGGWWVEPDCNLPTGESFVRQGLYGQRFLRSRFGAATTVGLNADPFGHNAVLPQILRGQGIDSYCFLRPGPHEAELPGNPFWWEAADGSRVLAYRIPHEYCSPRADIAHHTDKAIAQLPPGLPHTMVFYGVGDHGGGPTKANLESLRRLDRLGAYGAVECASPATFFDAAIASGVDFPVWRGDLQHHAAGCYAAHSAMKKWMRSTEHALMAAEKWSVVAAAVAGIPCPHEDLSRAWKQVLFNQFHDVLPGTSIEPAYDDVRGQLREARAIAKRGLTLGLHGIARDVDVPYVEDTQPILVFNPHPWPVRTTVESEFALFSEPPAVVDDSGVSVPVQITRPFATVSDMRRRRLVFPVDLPPLGYRLYRAGPGVDAARPDVDPGHLELENDHLRVVVSAATGWLTSLLDKAFGADLVSGVSAPHTIVSDDPTDTWGHRVVSYALEGTPFTARSASLVERGPVRSVIRIESAFQGSTLVEELVLAAGSRHLEVRVDLDWRERLRLAKLRFPTALVDPVATYEIPYGHIVRPADGAEEPGQSWVDITGALPDGTTAGLTIVNDAKAAYDVSGADVGITIARSPAYAWHEPRELEPDTPFVHQDQGRQTFRYLVVPHTGERRVAETARTALELLQPAIPMLESYHPGPLPAQESFASADTDGSVVVTVLKRSEDDPDAVTVRAYETAGVRSGFRMELLGRTIEAEFEPHRIKTFVVPRDPSTPTVETDLLETAAEE